MTSTQDKPVLDERMFQQLLAAAYTLQEYASHPPVMEGKSDCVQTLSCRAVAECGGPTQVVAATPNTVTHGIPPLNPLVPMAPDDVEPSAPFNDSLTLRGDRQLDRVRLPLDVIPVCPGEWHATFPLLRLGEQSLVHV